MNIAALIKQQENFFNQDKKVSIRDTKLKCVCCSYLKEERTEISLNVFPKIKKSKNKRIMKKRLKRYAKEKMAENFINMMLNSARKPNYRCNNCGQFYSFYRAMGLNLVTVQPMPEGAKIIY